MTTRKDRFLYSSGSNLFSLYESDCIVIAGLLLFVAVATCVRYAHRDLAFVAVAL